MHFYLIIHIQSIIAHSKIYLRTLIDLECVAQWHQFVKHCESKYSSFRFLYGQTNKFSGLVFCAAKQFAQQSSEAKRFVAVHAAKRICSQAKWLQHSSQQSISNKKFLGFRFFVCIDKQSRVHTMSLYLFALLGTSCQVLTYEVLLRSSSP